MYSKYTMVFVLDGNSDISAHGKKQSLFFFFVFFFLYVYALDRRLAQKIFFPRKDLFSFMRAQHDLI